MIKNRAVYASYEAGCRGYVSSCCEEHEINAHEILVKVFACNIYHIPHDVMIDLLSKVQNFALSPSSCIIGEVIDIGNSVTSIKTKDIVVGFVPLDSTRSGCAIYCIVNDFDAVVIPRNVDLMQVVATVGAGMKAFYALQYLARISIFDTILILDAASATGCLCVQLSKIWGAKVLAVASKHDKLYLENLSHPPDHIIEAETLSGNLSCVVIKETGGFGANVIIDNGVKLFSNEEDSLAAKDDASSWKPLKHEIISCLAPNGRWITSNPLLQIDPADSLQLFLLGASVNFLFEHLWSLAPTSQGKFLHIARDLVSKLESQMLESPITKVISFEDLVDNGLNYEKVDQVVVSIAKE